MAWIEDQIGPFFFHFQPNIFLSPVVLAALFVGCGCWAALLGALWGVLPNGFVSQMQITPVEVEYFTIKNLPGIAGVFLSSIVYATLANIIRRAVLRRRSPSVAAA